MSRASFVPLLLVANKGDLERKRQVSRREGKALADVYRLGFGQFLIQIGSVSRTELCC